MDRKSSPEPCSTNQIVAYLRTLTTTKKGLPYAQPVCVCASPSITTTHALLQLASSIGPHIAIFQVYADIIDDWSDETGRQLTLLAKRHGFLVWEGGRILNSTVDIVGKQKSDVGGARNELVSLIRKKYTKGIVRTASWAGIATAWASGVAVDNQEADILIPALKAAARETVAGTVQTIRTVITAENSSDPQLSQEPEDLGNQNASQQYLTSEYVADSNGSGLPHRKTSTISLTQTISQHTEESTEGGPADTISERRDSLDQIITSDNLPPPPLLARGIALCLPPAKGTSFTLEYRHSCIAAARANPDFVVGFLCSEPWETVSCKDDPLDLQVHDDEKGAPDETETNTDSSEREPCFTLFSIVGQRSNRAETTDTDGTSSEDEEESDDVPTSPSTTPTGPGSNPLALKLQTTIEHALKLRESSKAGRGSTRSEAKDRGFKVVHVPVVGLP